MSDILRITGMASGLDVDSMVKTLMKAENTKLDKVKQDKQIIQWKQDAYRDILGDINTFKSTYFDVLKPDTYMLSSNNYAGFDVTSIDNSNSTSTPGVTATAGNGAAAGAYTVEVTKLAKPSTISSSALNESKTVTLSNWVDKTINFSINGVSSAIKLDDSFSSGNINDLVNDINSTISNSNLKGQVAAVLDGDKIKFNALTSSSVKIVNTDVESDLDNLNGNVINPSSSTVLSDLGMGHPITFNINYNGTKQAVTIDNTKTINDAINAITTATSGNVAAKYSQLTGQFTLSTSNTGSSASISIDQDIPALGLTMINDTGKCEGIGQQDAVVNIQPPGGNKITITKSTNTFNIDGINYNLIKENTSTNINVSANTQKTFDKIKAFIDKYNEIIDKINTKITEKKDNAYPPLTDDQRKAMSADEIKAWEDKAKQGMLRNDNDLQGMLRNMRKAFFDTVGGTGVNLKAIGLDTSSDVTQGGKIIIDEAALKNAIQTKGAQVASLFMKNSSTAYSPDGGNSTRYSEEGIFQRLNDIISDYTRTTRNSSGRKGSLVEKAGVKGTVSEFNNLLTTQMTDKDKMISDLTKKLSDKQNNYYAKFSKLEQAMQQANSQSSWLSQQFGQSS